VQIDAAVESAAHGVKPLREVVLEQPGRRALEVVSRAEDASGNLEAAARREGTNPITNAI
jgi:hypothetical protein